MVIAMKSTKLHINAIVALGIMLMLAGGIIYLIIAENGSMSDTRFLHCIGLLGVIVWGVRACAMGFANTPANCPHCGGSLNTEGDNSTKA